MSVIKLVLSPFEQCELFEGKTLHFHVQSANGEHTLFSEGYCSQTGCLCFFLFPPKPAHQIQILNSQYTNTSEQVLRALEC